MNQLAHLALQHQGLCTTADKKLEDEGVVHEQPLVGGHWEDSGDPHLQRPYPPASESSNIGTFQCCFLRQFTSLFLRLSVHRKLVVWGYHFSSNFWKPGNVGEFREFGWGQGKPPKSGKGKGICVVRETWLWQLNKIRYLHFICTVIHSFNTCSEMTYIVSGGALNSTHSLVENLD